MSTNLGSDRIPVLGFCDCDNDVTQLFSEGLAGHKCVNQVQVFDNPGATWIDPDNDAKGSKVNPRDQVLQAQVVLDVACDRVLVVSDLVGDEAQRVEEQDHPAGCLKGEINEPLFEKEAFQTVIPIDFYDEAINLVAGSLQSELRRKSGRPPGGSLSRNDDVTEVVVSQQAVYEFHVNPVSPAHEKPSQRVLHVPTLIETKQMAENEPAHVRREKPSTYGVSEAGTVLNFFN